MQTVPVKRLTTSATLPTRAHEHDAGLDIYADEATFLDYHPRLISTGIAVYIPPGYVGFITPRSGLATKHGVQVVNTPGTIDAGYTGELKVCLATKNSGQVLQINRRDRIAQLVIVPITTPAVVEVDELPETARSTGGFGSTGK